MHAAAFRKFGRIDGFVFALDGDMRESGIAAKIRSQAERDDMPVVYVVGDQAPEIWVWRKLPSEPAVFAAELGIADRDLDERASRLDAVFDSASDTPSAIAKAKLRDLADALDWDVADVCRVVARQETGRDGSEIEPLARDLETALLNWRSR